MDFVPAPCPLPSLVSCSNLAGNGLAGALPDQLFAVHKLLVGADLSANGFTGALPDAWAASKVGCF